MKNPIRLDEFHFYCHVHNVTTDIELIIHRSTLYLFTKTQDDSQINNQHDSSSYNCS